MSLLTRWPPADAAFIHTLCLPACTLRYLIAGTLRKACAPAWLSCCQACLCVRHAPVPYSSQPTLHTGNNQATDTALLAPRCILRPSRGVVILPGLGNNAADYGPLADVLRSKGLAVETVQVGRSSNSSSSSSSRHLLPRAASRAGAS